MKPTSPPFLSPSRRQFLAGAVASCVTGGGVWQKAIAGEEAEGDGISGILPFERPPLSQLRASPRKVFAHWHVFPLSYDNRAYPNDSYTKQYMSPEGLGGRYANSGGFLLERPLPRPPIETGDWVSVDMLNDARLARDIGIDAFQFNITAISPQSNYWPYFLALHAEILRSKIDFKILVNFDCTTTAASERVLKVYPETIGAAFYKGGLMTAPDGRLMISAFKPEAWPAPFWRELIDGFEQRGIKVMFIPMFLQWPAETSDYWPLTDVASLWGGNRLAQVERIAAFGERSAANGRPWMAPIFPQDCRPKNLWYAEAGGSDLFRAGWMAAINSHAEMAAILTWNDYSESSEIRPSTGIQYGFYDLAAYYICWYKTGTPPPIVRDALYYFHRIEPTSGPELGVLQPAPMDMKFGPGPRNEIELLAFLTRPATLEIVTSERVWTHNVPEGLHVIKAPLAAGRPRFRLVRDGNAVIDLESAFTVRLTSHYQDLLYRSGSSNRPPVAALATGRP